MKTKNYPNQKIIGKKEIQVDSLTLEYSLFKSEIKSSGRHIYSIEISVSTSGTIETNFIYDITRLKKRAHEIFNLLYEGAVTPCTFNEVLEDIL